MLKKYDDLKGLSHAELEEKDRQSRQELYNLRFQKETGQLENTGRIREVRKMIARINTFLTAGGRDESLRSDHR